MFCKHAAAAHSAGTRRKKIAQQKAVHLPCDACCNCARGGKDGSIKLLGGQRQMPIRNPSLQLQAPLGCTSNRMFRGPFYDLLPCSWPTTRSRMLSECPVPHSALSLLPTASAPKFRRRTTGTRHHNASEASWKHSDAPHRIEQLLSTQSGASTTAGEGSPVLGPLLLL